MNIKNDGPEDVDPDLANESYFSNELGDSIQASNSVLPELIEKSINLLEVFNDAYNEGNALTIYQTLTDLLLLIRDNLQFFSVHQNGVTPLINELREVEFTQKIEFLLQINNIETIQSVLEFILCTSQFSSEFTNYYCEIDCLPSIINFIISDPDRRLVSIAAKILPIIFSKNIENKVEMNYITDDIFSLIDILLSKCGSDGLYGVLKFLRFIPENIEMPDEIAIEYFRSISEFFKNIFNGDRKINIEALIKFVKFFIKLMEYDNRFHLLTIRMGVARTVRRILSKQIQFIENVPPECMHAIINFYKTVIGGLPPDVFFAIKDKERGFYLNDIIPAVVSMARDETPKIAAIGIDFMNAFLAHNRPIFWEFFSQEYVIDVCFAQITRQASVIKRSIFRLLRTIISKADNDFAGWLIKGQGLGEEEDDESFIMICADAIESETESTILDLLMFLENLIAFARPYTDLKESLYEQLENEDVIESLYNLVEVSSDEIKMQANRVLALLEEGEAL